MICGDADPRTFLLESEIGVVVKDTEKLRASFGASFPAPTGWSSLEDDRLQCGPWLWIELKGGTGSRFAGEGIEWTAGRIVTWTAREVRKAACEGRRRAEVYNCGAGKRKESGRGDVHIFMSSCDLGFW